MLSLKASYCPVHPRTLQKTIYSFLVKLSFFFFFFLAEGHNYGFLPGMGTAAFLTLATNT